MDPILFSTRLKLLPSLEGLQVRGLLICILIRKGLVEGMAIRAAA
jgi:hypothetical protein